MENNTSEIVTDTKRSWKKQRKVSEKSRQLDKQNKGGYKKWLVIDTKDYLNKKKNGKGEYARNRYRDMSKEEK